MIIFVSKSNNKKKLKMSTNEIEICKLNVDSAKEQVDLINKTFNSKRTVAQWLHKHNSNIYTDEFYVYGAKFEGRIVGINAYLLEKYIVDGQEVFAFQSGDTAVDADFRRQGIFKKIGEYAVKELSKQKIAFFIGYPGYNSYPGLVTMGWEEINEKKNCFLISNPVKVFAAKFGILFLSKNSNKLIFLTKLVRKNTWRLFKKIDIQICIEKECPFSDKEISEIGSVHQIEYKYSKDLFEWKIDKNIRYDYFYYVARKQGVLLSFFIVKEDKWGKTPKAQMKRAIIVDWFLNKTQKSSLYAASALIEIVASKVDIISSWYPTQKENRNIFRRIGFFPSPFSKKSASLMIKKVSVDKTLDSYLSNSKNWDSKFIETDMML